MQPDEKLVQAVSIGVDGLGISAAELDQVEPCPCMRLGRDGAEAVPFDAALVRNPHAGPTTSTRTCVLPRRVVVAALPLLIREVAQEREKVGHGLAAASFAAHYAE